MPNFDNHRDKTPPPSETEGAGIATDDLQKPVVYTQKDLEMASRFVKEAEKLLGKLEIDGLPGISRSEIMVAQNKKGLSAETNKVFAGLNNMEPSVQDAWQVPGHRAHLKDFSEIEFDRSAAQLLRKHGDNEGAKKYEEAAAKLEKPTKLELAKDNKDQIQVYFHRGDVTKAQLDELERAIGRVQLAVKVLGNVDGAASELYQKLHTAGADLTPSDKILIQAVDAGKLNVKELGEALRDWATDETRADGVQEKMLYRAIQGYEGNGLEINTQERLQRELDSKNGSQLNDYRRANDGRHIGLPWDAA